MKNVWRLFIMIGACLLSGISGYAQFGPGGMGFHKPAIADIFQPEIGKGATYETVAKDGKTSAIEMFVVGREAVDGQDAYWVEFGHSMGQDGAMHYAKALITKGDFRFHRMVMQVPGQPQPVEMEMRPNDAAVQKRDEEMEKWHKVGTETITVPAGTFRCDHWTKEGGGEDVWVSSAVSPLGLVKQVGSNSSMTLTKTIENAQDHITGTPQKFDPQQMRQHMMEQMQQQHQKP